MEKRILVALDDSENAMRAVDFIATHFTADCKITLFSVQQSTEKIGDLKSPELTPYFMAQQSSFGTLEIQKKMRIEEAQKNAREKLMAAGVNEQDIIVKSELIKKGIARDIISEARSGYGTVVIGRRGLSGIEEFFLGSVSQKVLHSLRAISIIIVN